MSFVAFFKSQFARDIQTYASMKKQIEKKVESILADPCYNSEPLENKAGHDLRGLRSKRVDKNFRIIFAICKECKGLFSSENRPCRYCDTDLPTNSVVFFTVRPHKIVYKENKPLD